MEDLSNTILVKKASGAAIISLNRAPANSYYRAFLDKLSTIIFELEADKHIKVVLINSTSEKFFCAGADIKIFSSNSVDENRLMVIAARKVTQLIADSSKIYIAAIKGHVLGGGLELAMACDIRLAANGKYLVGLPEVKLGLMPGNGGTPRLLNLIGESRAVELLLTGANISAQKAYEYGLFNQLYLPDEFEEKVHAYVENLAKGAGMAMAATKKYMQQVKGLTMQQALDLETTSVNALYDTPDAKEGFIAFVEKREPSYL